MGGVQALQQVRSRGGQERLGGWDQRPSGGEAHVGYPRGLTRQDRPLAGRDTGGLPASPVQVTALRDLPRDRHPGGFL